MDFNQGEFDFDSPSTNAGWVKWRQQLDERKHAFEQRWGIILGKSVTLTLRDYAKPFTGIITIEPTHPKSAPPQYPLFRVGHVTFHHEEIISITATS